MWQGQSQEELRAKFVKFMGISFGENRISDLWVTVSVCTP